MAQTGYTPVQLYRSTTASAAPSAGNLNAGELAINTTDGKLYYKTTGGSVQLIGANVTPVANGGTGQTSYTNGQLLIGNTTGNTLTKATLTAGSGVSISNGAGSITISATGSGGDVVGPASSTDTAIALFDGTTGKLLKNSGVTIDDSGNTVISVNSSTNALRITQVGSGNALLVEDEANPDSTPFVINQGGNVISGYTTTVSTQTHSGLSMTPSIQNHGTTGSGSSNGLFNWASSATTAATLAFSKSISGVIGTRGALTASGSVLGALAFDGDDGTNFISSAAIIAYVDGIPATNDMPGRLVFSTTASGASTPTERMRIDNAGQVGIGTSSLTGYSLRVGKNITGATNAFGVESNGAIQSDVTTGAYMFRSAPTTQAASFTLSTIAHYYAAQGSLGATSAVTNQYGFVANSSLTGATNNYGFYGNIGIGSGRWNFYANGTADNFFAGKHTVGATARTTTAALSVTNPASFYSSTGTVTDGATAASGTVTHGTINALDNPAIAATNASVTYTNASTFYVDGAPTASTNVTITNAYATYIAAGANYMGGGLTVAGGIAGGTF